MVLDERKHVVELRHGGCGQITPAIEPASMNLNQAA